jgi:DNA mismatch repair protein MutL
MKLIQKLPPETINRIAAGEVIERPASVLKELIDNAIDAGANNVSVHVENGGLGLLIVEDDGLGMGLDDLKLSVERHATSKLKPDQDGNWDIVHIETLGFRGEALPSIGSVSKLMINSRAKGEPAFCLYVEGGTVSDAAPAAPLKAHGTRIEVKDLFYTVPARLKFMKSTRTETVAIIDEFRRQAMAHPSIGFSLQTEDRRPIIYHPETMDHQGLLRRLGVVLGPEFAANAMNLDQMRDQVRLYGYAGLPTFSRGNGLHQFLFVNHRPVRDKLLTGALRAAYADVLARDRYPVAALFVNIPSNDIDVNVHPAKTEIRFKNPSLVRGLIVGTLKHALSQQGHRAATTPSVGVLRALESSLSSVPLLSPQAFPLSARDYSLRPISFDSTSSFFTPSNVSEPNLDNAFPIAEYGRATTLSKQPLPPYVESQDLSFNAPTESLNHEPNYPLGAALAQIHKTYILSQTDDGFILVDQHAAHERLVYEALKTGQHNLNMRQRLLIPILIDLEAAERDKILSHAPELETMGLSLEGFGPHTIIVREVPSILAKSDITKLVRDLIDDAMDTGSVEKLSVDISEKLADHACRHSVRAGRELTNEEMNALLRQMESTPLSGQCNHGRPTYVKLKLKDIERLFGRSG